MTTSSRSPLQLAIGGAALLLFVLGGGWIALSGVDPLLADSRTGDEGSDDLAAIVWSEESLALAATLPVQDQGRVKPLDTYAQFLLLRANSRRSCETPDGRRISATEWVLDWIAQPQAAEVYRCFDIKDDALLNAIGVGHEGRKRRARYSYVELAPGKEKLLELAQRAHKKEAKDRDLLETQGLALWMNLTEVEGLRHLLDFARTPIPTNTGRLLQYERAFPDQESVTAIEALPKIGIVRDMYTLVRGQEDLPEERRQAEMDAIVQFDASVRDVVMKGGALALLPPLEVNRQAGDEFVDDDQWMSPGSVMQVLYLAGGQMESSGVHGDDLTRHLPMLELLGGIADAERAQSSLAAFHESVTEAARERGEYDKIPLEVSFYRGNYFFYGLILFLLSFLMVCFSWMTPNAKWLKFSITGTQVVATILVIIGITLRCIIRERPPISTLYETILFITAACALTGLAIEWINRLGVGRMMTSVLGAGGLFLAARYEAHEGVDTMPQLIAVLDTNFWLATHVTTVTLGYAAGLLASGIAHVWVFGKILGFKKNDDGFYRSIGRMVYGVIAFGLIFSIIGTILGGIWANYSWGRFWGWDPKENGALMIVLWQLAMLHGRMGGYLKNGGMCLAAIAGGMIVAFSWWGVNLLGVGLHSYGFTSGVARVLMVFYLTQSAVIAAGLVYLWQQRMLAAARKQAKAELGGAAS